MTSTLACASSLTLRNFGAMARPFTRVALHGVLGVAILGLPGCSAILDGLLSPYPSNEDQQHFLAELASEGVTGRERCRRMYDHHAGWAKSFSECQGFIDSLEALREAAEKGEIEVKKGQVKIQKDNVEIKQP